MQSSNTPGYQKVQQGQQEQNVNVYMNTPINVGFNVQELEDEKNNEWWQSVVASLITDIVGNATLAGILKGARKHKGNENFDDILKEIEDKKPDFNKDMTIDQSLVKQNQYNIGLQEIKQNFIQGIEQNGGYEKLSDQGKQQYNQVIKQLEQSQYESEKNLINRWSNSPEDEQRIQKQINEQKRQLNLYNEWQKGGEENIKENQFQYTPELEQRIQKQAEKLNMSPEELKEKLFQDQPLEFVSQEEARNKLFYDDYDIGLEQNEVQFNNKRDQSELNKLQQDVQKEKQRQFNENMQKINSLQGQNLEERQKQIQTLEKQLQSGVRPELYSWIDEMNKRTNNQYTPNKQGLIDYFYDYHNQKDSNGEMVYPQSGPFDAEIYRYNRYDNNDPTLAHRQAQNLKERLTKNKEEIKDIAQTALNPTMQEQEKLNKITQKLKQIIPENVQETLNLKPFIQQLEQGEISKQSFLDQLSRSIKSISEKGQEIKQQYITPINKLKQEHQTINKMIPENVQEVVQTLDQQSDNILSQLDKLSEYIKDISQGEKKFKFQDAMNYVLDNQANISSSLNKLNQALSQINEISQNKLVQGGSKLVDAIKGTNLNQYVNQMNQIIPQVNKIVQSVVELPNKGPIELIKQGQSLIQDAILNKAASKGLSQQNLSTIKGLFQDLDNLTTKIMNKNKKAQYGIPLSGYQVLEQKTKDLNEMSMLDVKDLLASDLQEQEQLVKNAKDKSNIFWRNSIQAPEGQTLEEYTQNMQVPTEKQLEEINQKKDQIKNLQQNEQYQEQLNILNQGKDVDTIIPLIQYEQIIKIQNRYKNDQTLNKFKLMEQQNENQIQENLNEIQTQYNKMNQNKRDQSQVNSYLQQLNQRKNELNKVITDGQQLKQNLTKQIQMNEQQQQTGWRTQNRQLEQNIKRIEAEQKQVKEKIDKINPKINEQQIQYNKLRNEIQYSQDYINQKQEQLKQFQQKKSELSQQIQNKEQFYQRDLNKINQELEKLKQNQGGKQYQGKIYSQEQINQIKKQFNETSNKINQLNSELLNEYEPQLNYLNEKKFQGNLSPEIRQEIEESLHAQNREQENIHLWNNNRISPHVPIPATVPVFFKPVKYTPDTELQSRMKLQKLGYNPEKSYQYNLSTMERDPKKTYTDLSYNQNVQDELQTLYNNTKQKLQQQKSFQWKDTIENYNKEYQKILHKHKNEMVSNEPQFMSISQLIENKNENRNQVKEAAGKYYDSWKRSRKNKDKFQYDEDLKQIQQQQIPEEIKRNQFISQIEQQYEKNIYSPLSQENVNNLNKLYNELKLNENKLHEIKPNQDMLEYMQQYPEEIQRQYQPRQIPENTELNYPYFQDSFKLTESNEAPYDNYLYDLGLEETNLKQHKGYLWENNQLQQQKIQQAIQDDIIAKYNGNNKNMKKVQQTIMMDPQEYRIAQTSDLYNTQELHKRINNLQYIRREKLEK